MYAIYADGYCIHNDIFIKPEQKVISPKLTMEDNSAGSLEMTIPKQNPGYDKAKRLSSTITVTRDNVFFWEGRIINDETDFQNRRRVTCEGELGYLNDTTQPPAEYHNYTVRQFLTALITEHNRKVDASKQFTVGAVTVHDSNDSIYRYTNSETTFKCISDKLVDRLGGHIRVRHVDDVRFIDYLEDYPNTNAQEVRFGKNLLDFTKNYDLTKLATVIMPRGARLDESPIEALEAYTTVESVNGGSIYVTSETAIKEYGWIEQVVDWDDVTVPANLLKKAKEYLSEVQFEEMVLELSAFDFHNLTKSTLPINLLDRVRCVSPPHGLDAYFPVSKVSLSLDQPDQSTYTFGSTTLETMSGNNKKIQTQIIQRIEEMPTKESILKSAQDNATAIINMATNGFITITNNDNYSQELYITDTKDYTKANKMWRWNINGLGYSKDGGKTFGLAMTMDGAIVANFITTGTMSADRVRTGILTDLNGNTTWNLNTGVLTMKKGSITLGGGAFSVNDSGYLTSTSGKIGCFTITNVQLSSNGLILNSDRVIFRNPLLGDTNPVGRMGSNNLKNSTSRGMRIDLDTGGDWISFGYYDPDVSTTEYQTSVMISPLRTAGSWTKGYMHLQIDMDGHGYHAHNLYLNDQNSGAVNGITGTLYFVKVNSINSDGTVQNWNTGCKMQFRNGFLVSATW